MNIPPPPPRPELETYDVLPRVLLRASELGAMVWRQNTGSFRTESGGWIQAATPGCSDILGLISLSVAHLHALGIARIGAMLCIETKRRTGRLLDTQVEFRSGVLSRHGLYLIARKPEDVDAGLGGLLS